MTDEIIEFKFTKLINISKESDDRMIAVFLLEIDDVDKQCLIANKLDWLSIIVFAGDSPLAEVVVTDEQFSELKVLLGKEIEYTIRYNVNGNKLVSFTYQGTLT